ncbi:MAG: serine/threonine protein kinase [Planctomycetes bacterium]|nr:serine/threonine protein kinase [Planctomycetota bacterium]
MSGDEHIGRVLGEVRLVRHLGGGGMSRVYEGRHRHLDAPVVVKLLDPKRAWGKPALVEAFLREARALGAVTHPHVVRVLSAGTEAEGGIPHLVLEHLPGGSLRARLRAGDLEPDEALRLLAEAGDGLGAAHAAGLVHGDVKPENLLLDAGGRIKVVDFGLAQVSGDAVTGAVFGTPAYMAPERCRGAAPDPRADVYALGVTLYECLTDQWPFNAPAPKLLLEKHQREAPPLEPLEGVAPQAVVDLIAACLAKDPAARPADGAAFARALRAASAAGGAASPPRRKRRRRLSSSGSSAALATVARRERRQGGGGATVLIVLLVAAALAVAGALFAT